ncbi:hypothetical protein KY284_029177 [Solanum tuberosum]|nr:hypothetical protein KY284_029177 [Solanum tuberosum]
MSGQISASTATDKVNDYPNFNLGILQVSGEQKDERIHFHCKVVPEKKKSVKDAKTRNQLPKNVILPESIDLFENIVTGEDEVSKFRLPEPRDYNAEILKLEPKGSSHDLDMLTNEVIELRKVLVNANENHKALKEKIYLGFTIFSKDYTSSPRCLEELTKIMECVDNKGQEFFFVFYKVKPSDGLSPLGTFEADIKGFDLEKVQRCKDALRIADDMAGSRDYFARR